MSLLSWSSNVVQVKPHAAGLIGRFSYLAPLHYIFKISPAEDSVMDLFYGPVCVCVCVCTHLLTHLPLAEN